MRRQHVMACRNTNTMDIYYSEFKIVGQLQLNYFMLHIKIMNGPRK